MGEKCEIERRIVFKVNILGTCVGTDSGGNADVNEGGSRIIYLRNKYAECSRIAGNLEITHISEEDLAGGNNLDNIFDTLEEVTAPNNLCTLY
jgi:hypothetical protein